MTKINCPKCSKELKEVKSETDDSKKQKLLFPQFQWGNFVCSCGYKTVRIIK